MKTTTTKQILEAINDTMIEKDKIKTGGIRYLNKMYNGTKLMPTPDEIKRVMLFGEGYYY